MPENSFTAGRNTSFMPYQPRVPDLRMAALVAAVFVYALSGTPTPENIGITEIFVGLALVAAVGIQRGILCLRPQMGLPLWQSAGKALLAYGLVAPLVTGLMHGHDTAAIIRDILPFLFLLLPLFLNHLVMQKRVYATLYTGVTILAGILFAARVLAPLVTLQGGFEVLFVRPADPFFLANAPTVLFAGLYGFGLGGALLAAESIRHKKYATASFAISLIPLVAMTMIVQRASLGYAAAMMLTLLVAGCIRRPYRMTLPLFVTALALAGLWPVFADIAAGLWQKTSLVGLNMRWQEALAVFEVLQGDPLAVLFGKGWGATIASPAVGGVTVNYTHSLLTMYWLKTGLAGLVFVIVYLGALAARLKMLMRAAPVMALALAGVLLINVFLYASFKSFDFGLVLMLIPLWTDRLWVDRRNGLPRPGLIR